MHTSHSRDIQASFTLTLRRAMWMASASLMAVACLSVTEARAQEASDATAQPAVAGNAAAQAAKSAEKVGILPEALQKALSHTYRTNPEIKAQRKVLEQLNENVSQAFSGWLPTASIDYNKGRQRNRFSQSQQGNSLINSQQDSRWSYSDNEVRQLTVEQPLFRGGETVAQTNSAEKQVEAGRAELTNTEQEIMLRAITSYMDVVRDRSVLELSRNNVDVLRKQLQASRDRFDVGEVTRTDVAQSEARLARAQNDEILAKGALTTSIANFERFVGYTPEELSVPEAFPEIPATVEEAVTIALESNPALISAMYRSEAAEDDVDVNVARILPDVSLRGTMRREQGAGIIGNADFDNDAVTVNVSVPLYQSGAEYSRIRASKSRLSEQRFQLSNVRDQVRQTVVQSWEDLETSISAIRATNEAIAAAQIALKGVRQEQLYGARTILDVLDAEQELFSAEVSLVRAQRDRIVAIFTLLARMGRLTPEMLVLDTPAFNPKEHYEDVRYQVIGF
jgi:TolC family type I secretion outer membrane protein